jgi:hypothetical protein
MDLGHRGSQKIRNLPPCLSNGTGSAETAFSGFFAAVCAIGRETQEKNATNKLFQKGK